MTIELLKSNIAREKELVNEINELSTKISQIKETEESKEKQGAKLIEESIKSLISQLVILNNAIPSLLKGIHFYKDLETKKSSKYELKRKVVSGVTQVKYASPEKQDKELNLGIKKEDQLKFLKSVTASKTSTQKIEKTLKFKREKGFDMVQFYVGISNKYFRKISENLVNDGYFKSTNSDLRKITSPFLLRSFVSMLLFSTFIAFAIGLFVSIPIFFINPFLAISLIFAAPLVTFGLFYTYPGSQRKSLEKGINQELPFVAIYMGAVATSGIEPTKIFSIIVKTKDYPIAQREIKKLLNYINFYGYDLVNALRMSAKNSPSEKLSMLLNGIATTIRSGGELADFLEKHSETLLFDYRLEREKYTKIAETFMDIYISIVIAAPMIMMILFVLISLTGYGSGLFTPGILSMLIVLVVSVLNIGFLMFLNVKQPNF